MFDFVQKFGLGILIISVFAGFSAQASAQSRKAVSISGVSSVGKFTSSATSFKHYSSGLGNLSRAQAHGGSGVLSSSIYNKSMYSHSKNRGSSLQRVQHNTSMHAKSPSFTVSRKVGKNPYRGAMDDFGGGIMRKSPLQGNTTPTLAASKGSSTIYGKSSAKSSLESALDFTKPPDILAQKSSPLILQSGATYISALDQDNTNALKKHKQQKIITLVPDIPGRYQELMQKGESAFRNGDFREAVFQFNLANTISTNSPESLLSLMHTYFATSHEIYSLPSFYLQETLKRFPELALIQVHPKAFYGNGADYVRDIVRLEDYVRKYPKNPNGLFLLGYIRWRDGDVKAAQKALATALQCSHTKELTEAINILWDGMVAGGKASGALIQEKKPEKKTSPEEKPPTGTKENTKGKKDEEKENRPDKPIS